MKSLRISLTEEATPETSFLLHRSVSCRLAPQTLQKLNSVRNIHEARAHSCAGPHLCVFSLADYKLDLRMVDSRFSVARE